MARQTLGSVAKTTLAKWSEDNLSRLASSFSYFAIFSIAPLLIIAVAAVGFIFGPKVAQGQLNQQVINAVGPTAGNFVLEMVKNAAKPGTGLLATTLGIVLLLYAATNLFVTLQENLNTIFNVRPKPGRGIKGILKDRALSFVMILGIGAILLASIILSAIISAVNQSLGGVPPWMLQMLNLGISLGIYVLAFAMIYKYLPDVRIAWRDVWISALLTAVLFTVAKWLLGFYLSRPSTTSVYGAAGSLVAVLLFIYYSSQIFFLGAEFAKVYACREGMKIQPSPNAELLEAPPQRGSKEKLSDKCEPGVGRSAGRHSAATRETYELQPRYGAAAYNVPGVPHETRPPELRPDRREEQRHRTKLEAALGLAALIPLGWFLRRKS